MIFCGINWIEFQRIGKQENAITSFKNAIDHNPNNNLQK